MRLNKYLAENSALSRRSADMAIEQGKVTINGAKAQLGADVGQTDIVELEGMVIRPRLGSKIVVLLNKPVGYVCSKDGQGSPTVYDLLPNEYNNLNIAGRLDKDSSGLVVLTSDGDLLYKLTHPSQNKIKIYEVKLNKPLGLNDKKLIEKGVGLEDGLSKLKLEPIDGSGLNWTVKMHEGRNRQIRRTFAALNYKVNSLDRIKMADYSLDQTKQGEHLAFTI